METLPYALATPRFRFQALTAHAGRAPLGGDREVTLGVLMVARLAAGLLPPYTLTQEDVKKRAELARHWLGTAAVPQAAKGAILNGIETAGRGDPRETASALASTAATLEKHLDAASVAELRVLAGELDAVTRETGRIGE
jgi:hypothetical protein